MYKYSRSETLDHGSTMSGSISREKKREYWVSQKKERSDRNPTIYRTKSGPYKARPKEDKNKEQRIKKQKRIESTLSRVDIKYQALHLTLVSPHLIVVEVAAPT